MSVAGSDASSRPHIAPRLDDQLTGLTNKLFRRRGWQPRVVPYTGYRTTEWVRVLARVLLAPPRGAEPVDTETTAARQQATRGWRRFLTTPIEDVEVEVELGGRAHLLRTARGGYIDAVLPVELAPGWHEIPVRTADSRPTVVRVCIIGPQPQLAIISDIDDTVVVTHLPRPMIAAWNTFVLQESARTPVRGMAEFYREILDRHPGALVVYLSTGAWNVAPTLTRFLSRNGFPEGPLLLTDWGPTNSGWFRSGRAHKHAVLRRLARELPQVRWLLIGDDGQHDPQIYADFAREQPGHVVAVAIRQLTAVQQVLSGSTNAADKHLQPDAVRTVTGRDGFGLASQLDDAVLLQPGSSASIMASMTETASPISAKNSN